MFKWLRKFFIKKLSKNIPAFVHPVLSTKSEVASLKTKKLKSEISKHELRRIELDKTYTDHLNGLLRKYFSEIKQGDTIFNTELFKEYNKRWKVYCSNANRTQKYLIVNADAFERNVLNVIKKIK